ncbi:MAG: dihydropteroate synthase [Actinomycetota bacterium]
MSWQQPRVMGVLNITPDSFSDGGEFLSPEAALAQAKLLISQGADILDIGGESTRPGAKRVDLTTEQSRILPVIDAVRGLGVPISIDTMNSQTAVLALEAGATIINDVSGGLADPNMFGALSPYDCTYILGHWRGHSDVMDNLNAYSNVAREVVGELAEQVAMAVSSGIDRSRIVVDPGIGFAKDVKQNWDLVARLDELEQLGLPILVGASRKRFLAAALNELDPGSVSTQRRDVATAVLTALLLQRKLWGIRVHNVEATVDAIKVVSALKQAQG